MVKPESRSLLQSIRRTWNNNYGSLLLVIGLLAAAAMSGVTYFKLVPEIKIIDDEAFARQLALSSASPRMKVDVIISGELPPSSADSTPVVGYIMAFPAFGTLDESKEALISKRFVLSDTGVGLLSCELPTVSQYAIVAFIDKNENQELDFTVGSSDDGETKEDEARWPSEPFRFSNEPGVAPRDLSLKPAAIVRGGTGGALVHFAFGRQALSR